MLTPVDEVDSLRFKVGDRVEASQVLLRGVGSYCRVAVSENRFPPGFVAAYQIQLDDDEHEYLIFAPRRVRAAHRRAFLQSALG